MKFCTVDAFSERLFSGNPAAVCVVESFPEDHLMQNIATEVNLSATAFVVSKGNNHFDIRWFTPVTEVKLCGHATLAAAHVLWTELEVVEPQDTIYFESLSGVIPANQHAQEITLNMPAFSVHPTSMPHGLAEALGISPVYIGLSDDIYLIEARNVEEVYNLKPDLAMLNEIDCSGFIITADSHGQGSYDFVSRFFCPKKGVAEDPATGVAHCKLAPFWAERLGKNEFLAYQASKRGGVIKVKYVPDRVYITGKAITAFSGRFLGVQGELRLL